MGGKSPEGLSLGTFSKVGSTGQFFQVMMVDIAVVNTAEKTLEECGKGAEGTPFQNMLLWHIDHSELRALEKQQVQEGQSEVPFSSSKQQIKLPRGRAFPVLGERNTYHRRGG